MITIEGQSDDHIVIDGHPKGDQVDCWERNVTVRISEGGRGVVVRMRYDSAVVGGCWAAEISQDDEGVEMLPVSLKAAQRGGRTGYSPIVMIEASEAASLGWTLEPSDV